MGKEYALECQQTFFKLVESAVELVESDPWKNTSNQPVFELMDSRKTQFRSYKTKDSETQLKFLQTLWPLYLKAWSTNDLRDGPCPSPFFSPHDQEYTNL
jgi:hypothetical protein